MVFSFNSMYVFMYNVALLHLHFQYLVLQIMGTITAPQSNANWKWDDNDENSLIKFSNINGLIINGGGTIDGQGDSWWNNNGHSRPTVS